MEVIYKNYETFLLLGEELNLISDETDQGLNTVAELGDLYHYMGQEPVSLTAAVIAYQEIKGRFLTDEELDKVLADNDETAKVITENN
jgi:hypothetical protein